MLFCLEHLHFGASVACAFILYRSINRAVFLPSLVRVCNADTIEAAFVMPPIVIPPLWSSFLTRINLQQATSMRVELLTLE